MWVLVAASVGVSCSGATDANLASNERVGRDESALVSLTWTAQGPAPMLNGQSNTQPSSNQNPVTGAIQAVVAHPTNRNILYAGSVNGGIWVTNNAQAINPSWTPLTDFQPSLAIGAIALDIANPQVIAAATGRWSSLANDGAAQGQVLVSRNAGQTWSVFADSLFFGHKASGVAIRGNTILASFLDSVGLVRSIDGGAHWTQVSQAPGSGLPFGQVDQVVPDQSAASRFYVTMSGAGVFRSEDTGATWVNISQNDPGPGHLDQTIRNSSIAAKASVANDGRVYVGVVTPNNPGDFDGFVSFVGYSRDHGQSWIDMDLPGVSARGNPFFHFAFGADPSNSSFVYVGGVFSWERGDAGITATGQSPSPQWKTIAFDGTPNFSSPHADTRNFAFDANLDLVTVGDGGIFKRVRPRETTGDWFSLAGNMQVAEIHNVAYDSNSNIIIAGTQDNGTVEQVRPGQVAWNTFSGGDGGDVQVDVLSSPGFSIRYTSFQGLGGFTRTTYNASNVQVAQAFPLLVVNGGGSGINGQFVTPVELNRVNPRRLVIAGSNAIFESFDQGDTITSLNAGGGASNMVYGHPANVDVIYAANGAVLVRLTATGSLVPTDAFFPTGDARDVVLDPASFRTAYVVGNTNVFVTRDAGFSWTDITGNLGTLQPGSVRCIEFVPGASRSQIVVGTDVGVFVTATSTLGTWQQVGTNLPRAPVDELQFSAPKNILVAGLLGRGAWSVNGLSK